MARSVTHKDLLWGYIAQGLNIGAGLILLPFILHYLPAEDVGLWFVFITLASFAQLLEFGFQPTLARNTAYIYAGAQSLRETGLPNDIDRSKSINFELLAELVAASKKIYQVVALLAAIVLLLVGGYYLSTLLTPSQTLTTTLLAWLFYASGNVVNFYYGYINGLMQGRGDMAAAYKVVILTRGCMLVFGSLAVVFGYGLLGLGLASFFTSLLGRWTAMKYYFASDRKGAIDTRYLQADGQEMIKTLWHNASRLGVVQVGAFLIQRANVLLASSFLGLAAAASYSMTLTLLMALSGMSAVILQVRMPHLATAQAAKDRHALRSLFGEIILFSWITYILGLAVLIIWGNSILLAISSKTPLLSTVTLALFGTVMLLELNHSLAASYLTTKNHIPFLRAGLISGIAITGLSLALVGPYHVWGLIVAQGLVQLAFNNWKWPAEARKDLGCGWLEILAMGGKKIVRNA